MKKFGLSVAIAVLVVSMLAVGCAKSAPSPTPPTELPYYQGKVITIVVSYSPGGGTDLNARLLAIYLKKYIPGNPTIVVRNMPGGGNTIGANYGWSAKPDGLTWLQAAGGNQMNNILRPAGVDHKLEEMHPILSTPQGLVYYTKPGIITEPKDIMTAKGLIWGHQAATTGTPSGFIWAKELLGFETEKMIFGYGGSGPSRLAFIQGESNICGDNTIAYNAHMKSYADKGEAVPIFHVGVLDASGNVVREASAPDVPTVKELYKQVYGKDPSGPVWEANKLITGIRSFSQTTLLPKGTPEDILDILRKAVMELVEDEDFLEAARMSDPNVTYRLGEELVNSYPAGVSAPTDVVQFMREVLAEKYDVVFD